MNGNIVTAYLLAFVNVLGFSLLIPVLPFVVRGFGASEWVFGLLLALYSGAQFFGAPYLGALSDFRGRKKILIVTQIGKLLSWIVFLIALMLPNITVFYLSLPLVIIGLARIVDGLTGGSVSVTNAYVSDITSGEQKIKIFGMMGGVAGLAIIIGPGIGGVTASSSLGFKGTALAAILISIVTIFCIFRFMKESLPVEKRRKDFDINLMDSIFILRSIRLLNPPKLIKNLLVLKFIFSALMAFYISTISLFVIDKFTFDQKQIGLFMLAVGIFMSFNQGVLSKFIVKKIGPIKTLVLGFFLTFIGVLLFKIPHDFWAFLVCYYIFNLGLSLCFPTFNALIAIYGDKDKQGETMGISESLNALAMTIFPVLSAFIYTHMRGEMYWYVSIIPFIALLFIYKVKFGKNELR